MKIVVQRVCHASVKVKDKIVSEIGQGFLALVGIEVQDTEKDIIKKADKLCALRIFSDENDKTNLSLKDVGGEILAVSQFTLCGDASHSNRPNFVNAMKPDEARELFKLFVERISSNGIAVKTGVFREHMHVELINDGPFTIIL